MKRIGALVSALAMLGIGLTINPDASRAGGDIYFEDDVVELADPVPYGVYPATFYRRYHYDYGRYWWYYDPYAYYGGHYGYHPRRWRPCYTTYHAHRDCCWKRKKRWKRRRCR